MSFILCSHNLCFNFKMGTTQSKEEVKAVDTNGNVNNNVIIEETKHNEIFILLLIICIIKLIEVIVFLYKTHKKMLKKKYQIPDTSKV